jgi:hypothetical protein
LNKHARHCYMKDTFNHCCVSQAVGLTFLWSKRTATGLDVTASSKWDLSSHSSVHPPWLQTDSMVQIGVFSSRLDLISPLDWLPMRNVSGGRAGTLVGLLPCRDKTPGCGSPKVRLGIRSTILRGQNSYIQRGTNSAVERRRLRWDSADHNPTGLQRGVRWQSCG